MMKIGNIVAKMILMKAKMQKKLKKIKKMK